MGMATSPTSLPSSDRKPWWLTTKKVVDKHVKEARSLIATRDPSDINLALNILDAALIHSPRSEVALELKARCLLHLRRYKEVADMLRDYIPSYGRMRDPENSSSGSESSSCGSSSENSSQLLNKDRIKLLHGGGASGGDGNGFIKCFSVSDLKNKVLAGLMCKSCDKEGQWRYIVLGQACCHLGLMEDAMALLQTGKRIASDAFRRRSNSLSDDSFSSSNIPLPTISDSDPSTPTTTTTSTPLHLQPPLTESESTSHLVAQIKILLRRRAAALAALDAGLYSESIRHFSKILDGRRPAAPHPFLAECYLHRSSAYRAAGRIAESIADCNKNLALDPSSVPALMSRAGLFELIGSLTDSVHDLEHAKLLLNSSLRDRRAPDPWKSSAIPYREIPGRLCQLTAQINRLKDRIANGEIGYVDYYALIGIRRGCSRSELDRAHLLLVLRHKPDRALGFVDRCEFGWDEGEKESARERARMSSVLLYRLIQKGYTAVSAAITEEAKAEQQRRKAAIALQETAAAHMQQQQVVMYQQHEVQRDGENAAAGYCDLDMELDAAVASHLTSPDLDCKNGGRAYQGGGFCRDLAVVGNLLSQAGFNRPLSVKYEALTC